MTKASTARYIVLDTETTGNDVLTDKPIEVAAVEWQNGRPGTMHTWAVYTDVPIKPSAMAVHHLTKQYILGQPTLEEILPDLHDFVGDSPLVIHNKNFDLQMLPSFAQHPTICSLRLARHTWEKGDKNSEGFPLANHQAQTLRFWLDLDVDTQGLAAHRAGADILVTGAIFQEQLDAFLMHKEDNLEDLLTFCDSPIQYKRMPFGKYAGTPFEQLPSPFLDFFLNRSKNKNPDPDVYALIQKEYLARLQEHSKVAAQLPSQQSLRVSF